MPEQVSVFLENKPGRLEKVTDVLAHQGVNIRAMTMTTSAGGYGVLNLLVDRPQEAVDSLRAAGHPAALRRIVVVEMSDRPGSLHEVVRALAAAGMNVENAYGTVLVGGDRAILIVSVESPAEAEAALSHSGVRTLSDAEVYAI